MRRVGLGKMQEGLSATSKRTRFTERNLGVSRQSLTVVHVVTCT